MLLPAVSLSRTNGLNRSMKGERSFTRTLVVYVGTPVVELSNRKYPNTLCALLAARSIGGSVSSTPKEIERDEGLEKR